MTLRWLCGALAVALLAPPLRAEPPRPPAPKPATDVLQIPYKLTDTQHVLVRAKINGKGPFNFIIDTGAPLLYVSTPVGKKIGLEPDKKGWATLDRFDIEGGASQTNVKCRVETPFQLEGMNSMGLAGVELHGIIGYSVLAHYRMEFDFTRDRLAWTRLDYTPPPPQPVVAKGGTAGIEAMAGLMKLAAFLLGSKGPPERAPRGFLGVQLVELEGAVTVGGALAHGPAAAAGLRAGDRISRVNDKAVAKLADLTRLTSKLAVGDVLRFTVVRGLERMEIAVRAGEGL
jgi:hypothetical protein